MSVTQLEITVRVTHDDPDEDLNALLGRKLDAVDIDFFGIRSATNVPRTARPSSLWAATLEAAGILPPDWAGSKGGR